MRHTGILSRRGVLAGMTAVLVRPALSTDAEPPLVAALFIGKVERGLIWTTFIESMRALGYVDGTSVRYAPRFAGHAADLPPLAAEIVSLAPRVIIANGDEPARALAAHSARIPIVAHTDDHVAAGLSDSYAHPSRNVTGVTRQEAELDAKRLQLLHEIVPAASRVMALRDPQTVGAKRTALLLAAAGEMDVVVDLRDIRSAADIRPAFAAAVPLGSRAVLVLGSPLLTAPDFEESIRAAAEHFRLPAMVQMSNYVARGDFAAYGPDQGTISPRLAYMADRILRGAKPAELPIEQPERYRFAVNLGVARLLGIAVPPNILARADEVIE